LFNKVAKHEVDLPDRTTVSLKDLLVHIKDHLIKERPDLFVVDGTVCVSFHSFTHAHARSRLTFGLCRGHVRRPGILVLVNDCDWELLGGLEHEVQDGDVVVFISTLHGG
jgi:ubiquitin related modifier 1